MHKKILGISMLAVMLVFSLVGCGHHNSTTPTAETDNTQKSETNTVSDARLYDKFLSIKLGSSYEEINTILGQTGIEDDSSSDHTAYEWTFGNDSIYIEFDKKDQKAYSKSQLIFSKTAEVKDLTLEKYKKIETGMSYEDVKKLIGKDGMLTCENNIQNLTKIYSWTNKNDAILTVTFEDDAVVSKEQSDLK